MVSRADRFETAKGKIIEAKEEMEALKEELQNWLDNMPENLQSSSKAETLQEAIDELENITENLEDVESTEVTFPGMMG